MQNCVIKKSSYHKVRPNGLFIKAEFNVSKKSSYQSEIFVRMFLLALLFFIGVSIGATFSLPGVTTKDIYPSCFIEDRTWSTAEAIEMIPDVLSLYSCQDLCLEHSNCHHLTWYNQMATPFNFACILYDHPTTEYPCTNCVSGPNSCTCSGFYSCQDNFVGEFPHVETEIMCQDHCAKTEDCSFYTWLDHSSQEFPNLCLMFSRCEDKEFSCKTCHSGPAQCQDTAVITSTTQITSMRPTTSSRPSTTTSASISTTATSTSASSSTVSPSTCELPNPQHFGDWFCPPSTGSMICYLECDPGYVSSEGTVITCQNGEWSLAGTCVPAIALITGGYDSLHAVEIYAEGVHEILPSLPSWRAYHTVNFVDSNVLLCGGTFSNVMKSCLILDPFPALWWSIHSNTTIERSSHCSVSIMGRLHLLGGKDSGSSTEHLSPGSHEWSPGFSLFEDAPDACVAKIRPEEFVMMGGGDPPSSSVLSYNATSGAYTRLQDLIEPRQYHGCVFIRDKVSGFKGLLVAGGHSMDGWIFRSEIYDMRSGQWARTGSLDKVGAGVRMIVLGERILAMGGFDYHGYLAGVEEYNITSGEWRKTEDMLEPRSHHAVTGIPPGLVGLDQN